MGLQFEWDRAKARANWAKHRITLDEAATVFLDEFSITVVDPDHSIDEDRWIVIGLSAQQRLLVVVFAERDGILRLISARRASRAERVKYEERT
jgi:uncharacterized DUF497 family protein